MFFNQENKEFIVRYRFKGAERLKEKIFTKESEAYEFYHGLENVDFKCFMVKSTMVAQAVLLYERY